MKLPDKSKFSLQQVMMSLSAVAYMPFHSINMLQDNLNAIDSLEQAYTAVFSGIAGITANGIPLARSPGGR